MKQRFGPLLLVLLLAGILAPLPVVLAERASVYNWFEPIVHVRTILLENYVEEPDTDDMQEAMINAMIATLDDPYTEYIPPKAIEEFDKQLRGTYSGIGAEVTIEQGYLKIITPMDDSPALEAGVRAGDLVIEIEGESTFQEPIRNSVAKLTGEEGQPVSIRVRHMDGTEEDLTITRRQIITKTVKGLRRSGEQWSYCVDDELGLSYIRLTQFNQDSTDELVDALNVCQKNGLNGLILDLRSNPGGDLTAATTISDMFLDAGTIVTVRDRHGNEQKRDATADSQLPDFPMIVLVDGGSASASEIVSGALQANGRAKVLGTRSYGKGSVQEVHPLMDNNGTLKYTRARYYLPNGRNIQRLPDSSVWGVDPDEGFVVPMTPKEEEAMILARREVEAIQDGVNVDQHCATVQWIRETLKDKQLASAVEALQERVSGSPWPSFGETNPAEESVNAELRFLLNQHRRIEERIAALQTLSEDVASTGLLPEGVDLSNGMLTLRDETGTIIGEYRIHDDAVADWLKLLNITPAETP